MTVTAAQGFTAAGVAAGLKSSGGPDVALVVNAGPSYAAAGVFTANRVQAAPVLWSRQVLAGGQVRAVVLNSGGANACTGPEGFQDTHRTAEHVASLLACGAGEVAVCSTGLIGERLPMQRLLDGVDKAAAGLDAAGGDAAAEAIRTTDTVRKTAVVRRGAVTVGGMAKGAGMLAPGLATMLCVLTTDAVATADTLDQILRDAVRRTFDRVDTDGCMSTNDTVLLLASGASGVELDPAELRAMVHDACDDLARQLVTDAEGATKDIVITVRGAASEDDAVTVARSVARSNLVKCAVHGQDPNWGRILAAVGTTDAAFEPDKIGVTVNGVEVCRNGASYADRALVDMSGRDVSIEIDLGAGGYGGFVRTTDLTAAYVHENSAYST
ncbi:MAG: glutamate N-acetyltransferase / amino-acid N-acetyltransferase [Frankiaceae bacterium]|jgi:glutamate N-acetyltransferase/amino-acid N-acetyltransferase|nr:glutamate N-acetyltransferase / amino-acid N-acetyltransferase [Frankiaceae bacterium]